MKSAKSSRCATPFVLLPIYGVNYGEKMTENFLFKAIFISLAAHTAVLCVTYFSRINDPHYKAIRQNRVEISYKPAHKKAVDIREYPIRLAQYLDLSNNPEIFSRRDHTCEPGQRKANAAFWDVL